MSDDTRERSTDAARDASAPPNGTDGNQNMLRPDGHLDVEMVSAWLDTPEDFSEQDRLAIETHLAGCAECRLIAAELTAIVRALQTLPLVEPARSFALSAQQAGLTPTPTLPASRQLEEPAHPHERRLERETRPPDESSERAWWLERQMSRLRWATTIAVMLFVFFVSVDVLGNIDAGGDDDDMDTASDVMPASVAQPTTTTAASSAQMATTEADDTARNAEQSTPAGAAQEDTSSGSEPAATEAAGSAPEPTAAAGGAEAEEEEEAPPAEGTGAEATAAGGDETMTTMLAPDDTEQASPTEEASGEAMMYDGGDAAQERSESETLHLIELALAIIIAWLIVALIALPRLRRPVG